MTKTGERHWIELYLEEIAAEAKLHNKSLHCYCTDCESPVAFCNVAAGLKPMWPYCPIHEKPLMILALQNIRLSHGA